MRQSLLELIKCPNCGSEKFFAEEKKSDKSELREGSVKCRECSESFSVKKGILDLLINPSEEIVKEQKGWTQDESANVNSKEFILSLPRPADKEHKEWWQEQADNYEMVLKRLALRGNETVLDVGAGRTWSTRGFAKKGCRAVGIDILREKFVGLECADYYLGGSVFFERVLADMNALPFKAKSFDVVFSTATLHHSSNLNECFGEISRVLKKNGKVVLVNEPTRGVLESKEFKHELVDLGVNEHKYSLPEWLSAMKRNGFEVEVMMPRSVERMMETGKVKGDKKYKVFLGKIASFFWRIPGGKFLLKRMHIAGQLLVGLGVVIIGRKVRG
ncbi:MAG: class I SAM-dependent methyltransferase [Candidatus Diapherotrites archaeon]|uniref:Class I SAM-dependent methyltransferase n=1 Tax=Candidatus Iainarchaeum sp. TaxID=3101447 RepID=A0A8T4L479_9ARCH|nr:class I SAM-dependent methyltransferase [Candidatus Diapherotrites archaeon]